MPQKHEFYGFFFFFLQFFESFRRKYVKYIYSSTGNEEWIESETVTITCDYVVT